MTRVAEFRSSEFIKIFKTQDKIFHETILNI